MQNLVIIGAGGFGREVLAWARMGLPHCAIRGFIDDNPAAGSDPRLRAPILGTVQTYEPKPDDVFLCALGRPGLRQTLSEKIKARGGRFATLVHPAALVAEGAVVEEGVIICPFALVSSDACVMEGSSIYYHASVDHDAVVGRWSQISAHCDITGGARLGERVFMGSHAVVLPLVTVGDDAVVGAGAVVTSGVPAGATVVGVPARQKI